MYGDRIILGKKWYKTLICPVQNKAGLFQANYINTTAAEATARSYEQP